jgi:hypothetical protein
VHARRFVFSSRACHALEILRIRSAGCERVHLFSLHARPALHPRDVIAAISS